VDGVITGAGVLATVATVVAIVVTFWVMVATGAGSVVVTGVASVVARVVETTVVSTVVTFAVFAGWVHPLIIAMTITRMNNPMSFFMEITLFLPYN
jgi:hypothetical protein